MDIEDPQGPFGLKYPITKLRSNAYHYISKIRRRYLRTVYGMDIGRNTRIARTARLDKTNPKGVHIGENTSISFQAAVLTHDFVNGLHVDTYIGDNCFVGARSVILPGVRVGSSCIIGAGSVVMNDVPNNAIAAGNPARLVRSGIRTREYGILVDGALEESVRFGTVVEMRPNSDAVPSRLEEFIRLETGVDEEQMTLPVADTGVDSFTLITLRTAIESRYDVMIPDNEWVSAGTLMEIAALPSVVDAFAITPINPPNPNEAPAQENTQTSEVALIPGKRPVDPPPPSIELPRDRFERMTHDLPPGQPASMIDSRSAGQLHRRHILEMSKMALSGMGEPWMFRELNDIHWNLICDFLEVPSSQVQDGLGDRLYATITRCMVEFDTGIRSFKENSPLDIRATLERYGGSIYFSDSRFDGAGANAGRAQIMSTFAKYGERGNNKSLVKGAPLMPDTSAIPVMTQISEFGRTYRERRAAPPRENILFETEYEIQGPHDINGAGLLYFAAYPVIFDLCLERSEGKGFLQAYTTVSKDLCYYANSEPDETLVFRLHERNVPRDGTLCHICSLSRKSDGVRMAEMIGTKRRVS